MSWSYSYQPIGREFHWEFHYRDGGCFIHSLNTETLLQLCMIESDYIQFISLEELFSRLILSVRPAMNLLPHSYPSTTITIQSDKITNVRGYFSPSCLYLYSQIKNGIQCERLDYSVMKLSRQGMKLHMIPVSSLYKMNYSV